MYNIYFEEVKYQFDIILKMDINYEYYKIFYYVAKYKSFTKAAEKLYANQPNITRTIKKLETSLGIKLFTRAGRNVELTSDGEILYSKIGEAVERIENAEKEISLFGSLDGGFISIGVSEVALHKVALPALTKFKTKYPKVNIRLATYSAINTIKALRNGEYDVAICSTPLKYDEDLEFIKICEFKDIPVYSSNFALSKKVYSPRDLAKFPLITLEKDSASYAVYTSLFASWGETFKPEIEVALADQILPMVKCGLGIGILPDAFIKDISSDIKIMELDEDLPSRNIYFVYRKNQPLTLAMQKLKEIIFKSI